MGARFAVGLDGQAMKLEEGQELSDVVSKAEHEAQAPATAPARYRVILHELVEADNDGKSIYAPREVSYNTTVTDNARTMKNATQVGYGEKFGINLIPDYVLPEEADQYVQWRAGAMLRKPPMNYDGEGNPVWDMTTDLRNGYGTLEIGEEGEVTYKPRQHKQIKLKREDQVFRLTALGTQVQDGDFILIAPTELKGNPPTYALQFQEIQQPQKD